MVIHVDDLTLHIYTQCSTGRNLRDILAQVSVPSLF